MTVRNATGASSLLIPESLVLHASSELRSLLEGQYDDKRTDYVFHALKRTQWAQTYEGNARRSVKPVRVAATANGRYTETRTCMICSTVGHIVRNCPNNEDRGENLQWALARMVAGDLTDQDWIVASGTSTHLVRYASIP